LRRLVSGVANFCGISADLSQFLRQLPQFHRFTGHFGDVLAISCRRKGCLQD
jgi:hypothetical protein